jgi:hypothetical protein
MLDIPRSGIHGACELFTSTIGRFSKRIRLELLFRGVRVGLVRRRCVCAVHGGGLGGHCRFSQGDGQKTWSRDVGARTRNQNNRMPDNVVGTRGVACWSGAAAK